MSKQNRGLPRISPALAGFAARLTVAALALSLLAGGLALLALSCSSPLGDKPAASAPAGAAASPGPAPAQAPANGTPAAANPADAEPAEAAALSHLAALNPRNADGLARFVDLVLGSGKPDGLGLVLVLRGAGTNGADLVVRQALKDLPWADRLVTGDTVRFWFSEWAGQTDAAAADHTPGLWDCRLAGLPEAVPGPALLARLESAAGGAEAAALCTVAGGTGAEGEQAWFASLGGVAEVLDGRLLGSGGFFACLSAQAGAPAGSWYAVEPASLSIGALGASPADPAQTRILPGSTVRLAVAASGNGLTSSPETFLDLSALGGASAVPCPDTGLDWRIPPDTAPGAYRVGVLARAGGRTALGSGLTATAERNLSVAPFPPSLGPVAAVLDSASAVQGEGTVLHLSVDCLHGADISQATVDLSGLGGDPARPLGEGTATASGLAWDLPLAVAPATVPGWKNLEISLRDSANGLESRATVRILVHRAGLAFANGDMEADAHLASGGLRLAGSAYADGGGYEGSRGLRLAGTAGSNDFIFRAGAALGAPPPGTTALSFRLKGSLAGKALTAQFGPAGSSAPGDIYSCAVVGAADKTVNAGSGHSYAGSVDTGGQWIKLRLVLVSGTGGGGDTNLSGEFGLKTGTGGVVDLWVDDFRWE